MLECQIATRLGGLAIGAVCWRSRRSVAKEQRVSRMPISARRKKSRSLAYNAGKAHCKNRSPAVWKRESGHLPRQKAGSVDTGGPKCSKGGGIDVGLDGGLTSPAVDVIDRLQ